MARKDDIFQSFLTHELLETKYGIQKANMPSSVREALNSDIPIIKTIALIVEGLEGTPAVTDSSLRNQVIQYLNEAI